MGKMHIDEFVDSKLIIVDGFLLDEEGNVVMSDVERLIMKKSAEVIAKNGGDILNIGFGLGIIDEYIQTYNPTSHTIIEINKLLVKKMLEDGWGERADVICSDWKPIADEYIKAGVQFDGIYLDTYFYQGNSRDYDFNEKYVFHLLKPGGIYSNFANLDIKTLKDTFKQFECDIECVPFNLDKEKYKNKPRKIYDYIRPFPNEHRVPIIKKI